MAVTLVPSDASNSLPGMAVVETNSAHAAARAKALVEARVIVAHKYPRNDDHGRIVLMRRCASFLFAESAQYSKPVGGGKNATGASIRFMEEVARTRGNIDVTAVVTYDDRERRGITVTASDLEVNYSASVDVLIEKTVERKSPRQGDVVISSRVNSQGAVVYRIEANEDDFAVKQGAQVSKARREMIRAIVPSDLVEEAMAVCAATRKSEVRSDPSAARKRVADAFYEVGVMPGQLAEFLGKPSLEAVTEAEIEYLRAIFTAMRDEGATWADVIEEKRTRAETPPSSPSVPRPNGAAGLRDALRGKTKKATEETDEERAARLADDARLAAQEG